jgi:phospholipid/cholesterol/gamma-HCH transport system substrate-binding protein
MINANKASANFATLDFKKTLASLDSTLTEFNAKISSKEGSLGLLLNDTKVYDNLASTSNKLNILLDDIRVHPKRYLSFSVFGRRDKGNYITTPLIDDTLKVSSPADSINSR